MILALFFFLLSVQNVLSTVKNENTVTETVVSIPAYSQVKLAELCEISTNFIGEIEIGRNIHLQKFLKKQ